MRVEEMIVTVPVPQLMRNVVAELGLPFNPSLLWISDVYQTTDAEGNPVVSVYLRVDPPEEEAAQ